MVVKPLPPALDSGREALSNGRSLWLQEQQNIDRQQHSRL